MTPARGYRPLKDSVHSFPKGHKRLRATDPKKEITVTLILRRNPEGSKPPALEDYSARRVRDGISREEFASERGAASADLKAVEAFAREKGLRVLKTRQSSRSIEVGGTVSAINKAFAVKLNDYESPVGRYYSHEDAANVPAELADVVEAVIGLNSRPVKAQHYSTARRRNPADPPNTKPVAPQQIATLYNFPPGSGAGQTIGIYEMQTGDGRAGYTKKDLADTMAAFGGNLKVPVPIDVAVDGIGNSGVSDGETGLDITVAGAIAQDATIAVYFTGAEPQNILHAIQRMVHPDPGDPEPTILSISYGWGPDDKAAESFSEQDYTQLDKLFQDAADLGITVLVSSGDSGAYIESKTEAQASYPATEPWVVACGGTTVGDVNGKTFDEYVWNDTGAAGPGATGGGVSRRFPLPSYQAKANVPKNIVSRKAGRGIPDIAGNASENSGYMQYINGDHQPVGGTSAVAPLYAGLIARINANLGFSAGFINPLLYTLGKKAFRNVAGPPGPTDNSYGQVTGYPASAGWNACTGLGSADGLALQNAIAQAKSPARAATRRVAHAPRKRKAA